MNKPLGTILQEELESRVVHGLRQEWECSLWILPPAFRHRMKPPIFALEESSGKLGRWNPETREMSLSRSFALNHAWDSVREVVLHETAHQLADEVLGAVHETAHGPTFQEACQLLRANPKASGAYPPLRERILGGPSSLRDGILIRIKKLMALTESRNLHEAEVAMAKARLLMKKYQVEGPPAGIDPEFVSIFAGKPALRHAREVYHISGLLQDFYAVAPIWIPTFVLEKGKMGRVLEISGTAPNVAMAAYVYDFLCGFIEARWQDYRYGRSMGRSGRTDFAVGIIRGFRTRLESVEAAEENKPEFQGGQALARIENPGLEAYLSNRYPRTVSRNHRPSSYDAQVYRAGLGIGEKLVIRRGISGGSGQPLMIEES